MIHSRGTEPPVQRYQHIRFGKDDLGPIYGEFLTPLTGSEVGRDGSAQTVKTVQEGLTAQALRYLDLLFEFPTDFDAATIPELGLTGPHVVRLPHPATYVLQKLLAWPARDPDKRAKDLAYIFEVALLTRDQWPKAGAVIENLRARDREHSVWIRRAQQLVERQFQSPAAEGPVAVARIYRDVEGGGTAPSESAVYTIVRRFAEAVGLGTARA